MHDLLTRTLTDALYLSLWVSLPVLGVGFVVALLVGLGQAFSQLGDPALNAIPRSLAVFLTLGLAGTWMAQQLVSFTSRLLHDLPALVH
ncbi:MAG: flagellar biosynthetic protein FliQ [Myxococcales bacterium]